MKVARITLGDLNTCHSATNIVRCWDGCSEVSRGRSSADNRQHEGLNIVNRD